MPLNQELIEMCTLKICGLAIVCLALGQKEDRAKNMELYITQAGQLRQTLEIKSGQQGFAGLSGKRWVCDTSGKWSVSQFVGDRPGVVERKGDVGRDASRALGEILARDDFLHMPDEFGNGPKVNGQVVSIKFGGKECRCVLPSGQSLHEAAPKDQTPTAAVWKRFISTYDGVQEVLKKEENKSKPTARGADRS
jgi:hypothetical protein